MTAFIVENGTPGLAVGTIEHKMGIHGSATSEIVLDEVVVPSANVLGQVGAGFITFMASLDTGRLGLGAACLGGAQAALDSMCRYAAGRSQFGKAIGEKQAIQWIIANTATEVEALRSLVYRTAWMVDTGQPYSREGAMCKLLGSELASGPLTGRYRFTAHWAITATSHWSAPGATRASPRSSRGRTRFNGSSSPDRCCGRMACACRRSWKLEAGNWKPEAGNWKLETGLPAPRSPMLGSVILNGLATQLPMRRVTSDRVASCRKNLVVAFREQPTRKLAVELPATSNQLLASSN